jgi:hypothetical protein
MIATIMTIMSGMTAKTVPIAYTLAKGIETIASSIAITAASRIATGSGAIAIQIATSFFVNEPTKVPSSMHRSVEEGFGFSTSFGSGPLEF